MVRDLLKRFDGTYLLIIGIVVCFFQNMVMSDYTLDVENVFSKYNCPNSVVPAVPMECGMFPFNFTCRPTVEVSKVILYCQNVLLKEYSFWINPKSVADPFVVYISCDGDLRSISNARTINVAWIREPYSFDLATSLLSDPRFQITATYFKVMFERGIPSLAGAVPLYLGAGGNLPPFEDRQLYLDEKTKDVIFIFSNKRKFPGHILRHELFAALQELPELSGKIDYIGGGVGVKFKSKFPDYSVPYRYSIVIENMQIDYYVSEKLTDTVLAGIVPIYWGMTNISQIIPGFDDRGVIYVSNLAEYIYALKNIVSKSDYLSRVEYLRTNLAATNMYAPAKWSAEVLLDMLVDKPSGRLKLDLCLPNPAYLSTSDLS